MDSGNSSSVQSSSGGDDQDAESISTFLGPHGDLTHQHSSHLHASSPRPPPSSFFDPLSTYLDAFTRSPPPPSANPDSLLNLDMSWAGGSLRALDLPPSCTDVGAGLLGSVLPTRGSPTTTAAAGRGPYTGSFAVNPLPSPSSSTLHQPPLAAPPTDPAVSAAAAAPPQRSSRKRSRASRRAPTTVLTTDTSNFRAMVQEFTGIPAPPFSSSPFPPRSRFDLFHPAVSSPGTRSPGGVLGASPHSLLRPFAQKVPVPSFGPVAPGLSSSSPSSAPPINTAAAASATATTSGAKAEGSNLTRAFATDSAAADASPTHVTASIANSSHLPPSLGDQHQSLLSMFNFQPSPSTRYSSLDAAVLGAARAMQESGRAMPTAPGYAAGGRPRPASEGMPASTRGASGSRGGDLLHWVEGSGGSERRG